MRQKLLVMKLIALVSQIMLIKRPSLNLRELCKQNSHG